MTSVLQQERVRLGTDSEPLKHQSLVQENKIPSAGLLLILGEPISVEQKDLIFERIVTELSTWDQHEANSDIDEVLGVLAANEHQAVNGPNGEKTFHHACCDGDVIVDVLINPRLTTLIDGVGVFLRAPARYRHLVYAGLALAGSGSWIAQDGLFTFKHLTEAAGRTSPELEPEIGRVLVVSAFTEGEWTEDNIRRIIGEPDLVMRLNPGLGKRAELETAEEGIIRFADGLSTALSSPGTSDLLQPTAVVGNISFARPTLYIFPAGDGDSALFGVSGFTMLVDGGFRRRACFWDFAKHLTKIDALVATHIGGDSVLGLAAFLERKAHGGGDKGEGQQIHPEVGVVFMNVGGGEKNGHASNTSSVHTLRGGGGGLLVSLADECINMVDHLHHLGLKPLPLLASASVTTPVNLYYKIGHGSLDMYVLNPVRESREFNEFLAQWVKNLDSYGPTGRPVTDNISVACVVVWSPASPLEPSTRIMFTGGLPQSKLLEGLNRLSSLPVFQSKSGVGSALVTEKKKPAPQTNGGTAGNKVGAKVAPTATSGRPLTAAVRSTSTPTATVPVEKSGKKIVPSVVVKDERVKKVALVKVPEDKKGKSIPSAKGAEVISKPMDQAVANKTTKKVIATSEKRDVSALRAPAETKTVAPTSSAGASVGHATIPSKIASKSASTPTTRLTPKDLNGSKNKKGDLSASPAPISHKKNASENINNSHAKKVAGPTASSEGVKEPGQNGVKEPGQNGVKEPGQYGVKEPGQNRVAKDHQEPGAKTPGDSSVEEVTAYSLETSSVDERTELSASLVPGIQTTEGPGEILFGGVADSKKFDGHIEVAPLNLALDLHTPEGEPVDAIQQSLEESEVAKQQAHQSFTEQEAVDIPTQQTWAEPEEPGIQAHQAREEHEEAGLQTYLGHQDVNLHSHHQSLVGESEDTNFQVQRTSEDSENSTLEQQPDETSEAVEDVLGHRYSRFASPDEVNISEHDHDDLVHSENSQNSEFTSNGGVESVPFSKYSDSDIDQELDLHSEEVEGNAEMEKREPEHEEFDALKEWDSPQSLPSPVGVGSECDGSGSSTSDPVATSFPEAVSASAVRTAKEPVDAKLKQSKSATVDRNGAKKPGQAAIVGSGTDVKSVGGAKRSTHDRLGGEKLAADPTRRVSSATAAGEGDLKRNGTSPTPSTVRKPRATQSNETATVTKKILKTSPTMVGVKSSPPFFVDLVYVPRSGIDAAFFQRIRASMYVMSAARPDTKQLDLIVDAQTDTAAPIRIIPTHSSDELASWIACRSEDLERLNITVLPAADRCTIQLQEQDTSCYAYRLEF